MENPAQTQERLGLDVARSWIDLTDANRFVWPVPDLRPAVRGDAASIVYGELLRALFRQVRDKFVTALETRFASVVKRTDD